MSDSQDFIQEAIKTANAAAQAAEPALRTHAFEVVLTHLLNSKSSSTMAVGAMAPKGGGQEYTESNTAFDSARVATHLELSAEQVEEIYDLRDTTLFLSLKPVGATVPEQRRALTHLLLVGYKFGLGAKSVPQSKIVEAADEWNLVGANFSRDIRDKYIHAKAGGKGSDPLLSLAPGSLESIIVEAKAALGV